MKRALVISACVLGLAASAGHGAMAFWNFNDTTNLGTSLERINPLGDSANMTDYANDLGSFTAFVSTWGGGATDGNLVGTNGVPSGSTANNFGSFVGTADGDLGTGSGGSLSIVGTANNGNYFIIKLNDAVDDTDLSYWTRGTGTGFDTHTVDYSTDGGGSWTLAATLPANQTAGWQERTVAFGNAFAATSGPDTNLIRVTVSGATGTSGNSRFDNILIVPEPATLALLGLGSILVFRRRRN